MESGAEAALKELDAWVEMAEVEGVMDVDGSADAMEL